MFFHSDVSIEKTWHNFQQKNSVADKFNLRPYPQVFQYTGTKCGCIKKLPSCVSRSGIYYLQNIAECGIKINILINLYSRIQQLFPNIAIQRLQFSIRLQYVRIFMRFHADGPQSKVVRGRLFKAFKIFYVRPSTGSRYSAFWVFEQALKYHSVFVVLCHSSRG